MVGSVMFTTAIEDKVAETNPFSNQKIKPAERREMTVITRAQYERLLTEVPEHYRLLIRTLAETGCRWGEALGLRPGDLDEDVLHIERVMSDLGSGDERFPVKDYTKNGERRQVTIGPDLAGDLRAVSTDSYLFRSARGADIGRGYFHQAVWVPARTRAGLPSLRVHDLRHSHASWLLAGGCDVVLVGARLGHRDLRVTGRYLHPTGDSGDRAVTAQDRFLGRDAA